MINTGAPKFIVAFYRHYGTRLESGHARLPQGCKFLRSRIATRYPPALARSQTEKLITLQKRGATWRPVMTEISSLPAT